MSQEAIDFLEALGLKDRATGPHQTSPRPPINLLLTTIPSSYSGSGGPPLLFDGETTAGTRTYSYLSSYTPTIGDRVLVAMVGHGGVVLGKILN